MAKDPFSKIWNSATETIAEIYEPGTFDLLEKKDPELYRKIDSAEDKVNSHWGKDPSSFEKSVNLWKGLMRQAILAFQAASGAKKEAPEGRPSNIFERIRGVEEE